MPKNTHFDTYASVAKLTTCYCSSFNQQLVFTLARCKQCIFAWRTWLSYLSTTRPDITFITQQLSQYLYDPTITHHNVALRILRYLKGSPSKGLFFPINYSITLQGFLHADWAECLGTRISISGQCFLLGHSHISWRTKKQIIVSRSSSIAEYRALTSSTCELQCLLYLLQDLSLLISSFMSYTVIIKVHLI